MKMDMQMRLADRVAAYKPPPGAPSVPQYEEGSPASLVHASAADVARPMAEGKLRQAGERFARSGDAGGPSFIGSLARKAGTK
jgi:hypothetical protein